MALVKLAWLRGPVRRLHDSFAGPQLLAFLPAITLGSFWLGGEGMLLFLALALPAGFALAGLFSGTGPAWSEARDRETDLRLRTAAERAIDKALSSENTTGKTSAALVLEIEGLKSAKRQLGSRVCSSVLKRVAERLAQALRDTDHVVRLSGPRFAIALGPVRRADLETMIQLSNRLQQEIAEPISVQATRVHLTASIGFCLPTQAKRRTGADILGCAEAALERALESGPNSIRFYEESARPPAPKLVASNNELRNALESHEILPWFQPQVSTRSGEVTGFEALARWDHPKNGILLPRDFLPMVDAEGLHERLCQTMVAKSLAALKRWEKSKTVIPCIAVNFTRHELTNPKLCEWIDWELDRFEVAPGRLRIEIAEDEINDTDNDVVVRNIQALGELGCGIDLDQFGAGHASIAGIRRFPVGRIKIDRSFVTRIDRDREQQKLVATILTMAQQLEIDTLAAGVETLGEHALLAQLGCGHVQGLSVSKPLPLEAALAWILKHNGKVSCAPDIGRSAG